MKVRTIFLSDIHLGTRGCQASSLLDFLKKYDVDTIYFVGDIIDLWAMRSKIFWPKDHNRIIQELLKKAKNKTKIYYIPGNHDELLRDFVDQHFGNIQIKEEMIHVSADRKRYLVLHGDKFDFVIQHHKWVAMLGSFMYDFILMLNYRINSVLRKFGFKYYSISKFLKRQAKEAVSYIGRYEQALIEHAQQNEYNGIISGHIHHPETRNVGCIKYMNCGDWVESKSAIIEDFDGNFHLIEEK